MATSGSLSTGALSATTTYTLTCTGAGGSASQSAAVTVAASTGTPPGASCTGTSGPLTLKVTTARNSGISPLLVFFDATGTTDTALTGNTTAFQDVTYTWNFGDTGASGTGTWAYGSNPGKNSRNTATGGVAAHLYITEGSDTTYTATVTATDGTNTATCQLGVTAYDPAGSNGFPGSATTCVYSDGSVGSGCPAGAQTLSTSSFKTALGSSHFGNGKQVLFKCGDTFTGESPTLNAVKWSIGAYGGCQGTQTNRPLISDTGTGNQISIGANAGDGRVSDLSFEGNDKANASVQSASCGPTPYQLTLSNLYTDGDKGSYSTSCAAQFGVINSVQSGNASAPAGIGVFINYGEDVTWTGPYPNTNYTAFMGNSINTLQNIGQTAGIETVRVSACRLCVFSNSTFENASAVGAVFKMHNGNPNSGPTWSGIYTELIEISDNLFTGTSGAQLVENAPQNSGDDERLRNIVVERNVFAGSSTGEGRQILVSAVNETLRDNVFNGTVAGGGQGAQIAERGIEPVPQGIEFYNNTCYGGGSCAAFSGANFAAPGINSFAQNNLLYNSGAIANSGTGNTVSANTATPSSNPGFINGSGTFLVITDFTPSANYSGGTSVPVFYDALGIAWSPTWDLGALHP